MKTIDGKKMKELLEKKHAMAIDIDTESDFKKGHIRGAVNIPHNQKEFVKQVEKRVIRKSEDVVLCGSDQLGTKLDKLSNELEKAGYKNVYQYKSGPAEWKASGLAMQSL